MTENMFAAICLTISFTVLIGLIVWLTNRREERDAELLYFKETGKMPKRYLR